MFDFKDQEISSLRRELDSLRWALRNKENEIFQLKMKLNNIRTNALTLNADCKTQMRVYYKGTEQHKDIVIQRANVKLSQNSLYYELPGEKQGSGKYVSLSNFDDIVIAGPNGVNINDILFYC